MIYKLDEWGLFSAFMLIAWVPFGLWLFSRQRPTRAAFHVLVWGAMWLPEAAEFDFPLLPPLDKFTICALTALIGLKLTAPDRLRAAKIGRGYDWFLFLSIAAQAITVSNNGQELTYGTFKVIHIPAFTAYDGLSAAIRLVFSVGVPCWLGRALLRGKRDLLDVLEILIAAGLVYSVPILWETKMSPALHANLYGFNARYDWSQNIRMGGFRATVFMGHGLIVGFFMFLCTTAAVVLRKAGQRQMFGVPMGLLVLCLFLMLLVCKAIAALLYGLVAYMLICWCSVKWQLRTMFVLSLIVALYPVSRMFDWFPVQGVLSAASVFGPERVQSMQFRFDNEDLLLLKGADRFWFGWGGFGRDRVYDSWSAKDLVVQDGHWIAVFGQQGLVGFVGYFAIVLGPVVQSVRRLRKFRVPVDQVMVGGMAVMVVVCCVNLVPNMSLPNLHAFLASGLSALLHEIPKSRHAEARATACSAPAR